MSYTYREKCPVCGGDHDEEECPTAIGRRMGSEAAEVMANETNQIFDLAMKQKDDDLTALRAENARLVEVLKQLEWLSRFVNTCPLCYKRKETGHADDCPIGTALKGAENANPS